MRREVYEETNIRVGMFTTTVHSPGRFPSALMLGFIAEATSDEIILNDGELEDARWFSRRSCGRARSSCRSGFLSPGGLSITGSVTADNVPDRTCDGQDIGTRLFSQPIETSFMRDPTKGAHWWPDKPDILGGRDLQAGGTWLALHRNGRFATVTNFRDAEPPSPGLLSRGHLVTGFLESKVGPRDTSRQSGGMPMQVST